MGDVPQSLRASGTSGGGFAPYEALRDFVHHGFCKRQNPSQSPRPLQAILKRPRVNRLILLLTLFLTTNCFGQDKFVIKEIIGQNKLSEYNVQDIKINPNNIFEDSLYVVSKTCSGEWGGTIKFKNKKTGVEYSAASTCPIVVNKFNGKYYITNTLAHLSGFSEILEISNPDSMSIFKLPKPRAKKGKTIVRYVGDNETKSTKGTRQLVDSIGVLTLSSFPYDGQLYYIVTDFKKTYLTKIENHKFVTIDTISNKSIWTYDPEVFIKDNGHRITVFKNQEVKGVLDIYKNQITIIRKK